MTKWKQGLLEEGRATTKLEGEIAVLRKQIELKYGALLEVVASYLEQVDESQLSVLSERILFVDSLESLLD